MTETDQETFDRECAEKMGVSVVHFQFMRKQAEEVERKLREGFQAQAVAEPWRRFQLSFLRPVAAVTPHPNIGGKSGDWKLVPFRVTADAEHRERMRAALSVEVGGRFCTAGYYTKLMRGDVVVMSDTDDELLDLWDIYNKISEPDSKRIIINGLGLGCVAKLALSFDHVEHVDVVEFSEDVISLTAPLFESDRRLVIHHGDAYTYKFPAGTRWDVAWHDIWDEISIENDFETLHRRYGHRVVWQSSWARQAAIEADKAFDREIAELHKLQKEFEEANKDGGIA